MRKLVLAALLLGAPALAHAGGCYVCASGSAAACRDYCQYEGPDTFDARHRCEAKGCKVSGTSACPSGAPAAKICQTPAPSSQTVAVIPWCAAGPGTRPAA